MKSVFSINDMDLYLTSMKRSMWDKLFFVDKIFEPLDCLIDFGCADGELIKKLQTVIPTINYIGYDSSEEMIKAAQSNVPDASFYTEWNNIPIGDKITLLNISSTVHEVYSYQSEVEIKNFWDCAFNSGFKYIAIRDMCISKNDDVLVDNYDLELLNSNLKYSKQLKSFENVWGKIRKTKEFVHFLLKYTYVDNWNREVAENYLPIYLEELISIIPDKYEIVYFEHYTLPYKKWEIENDFGIKLKCPTHIKFLIKRKHI